MRKGKEKLEERGDADSAKSARKQGADTWAAAPKDIWSERPDVGAVRPYVSSNGEAVRG